MVAPTIGIYMLTEDSSERSHKTWHALLRRISRFLDPHCETHKLAIDRPDQVIREVMAGNLWRAKSSRGHSQRVLFWRTLTDRLCDNNVVLFHVDGDVPWSKVQNSENIRQVEEIAVARLRDQIIRSGRTEECLAAFTPLHPCYAIEAWLFHNYDTLTRLYRERRKTPPECIDRWRRTPSLLDEEKNPKTRLDIRDKHNALLAKSLVVKALDDLGSSFHAAVEALQASERFQLALRETYTAPVPPSGEAGTARSP